MNTHTSLAQIVTKTPRAAEIFARYGLDFCCHGQRSLADACQVEHLDPKAVLHEIDAIKENHPTAARWDERPLDELIEFILDRYHNSLRVELPFLIGLSRKVEATHKGLPGCPVGLTAHLEQMHYAILNHLAKEEEVLFPMILSSQTTLMPIKILMQEHEEYGEDLQKIRALTNDLSLPVDHCVSWKELYLELHRLETELMEHIHLENNVLFPRALAAFREEGAEER